MDVLYLETSRPRRPKTWRGTTKKFLAKFVPMPQTRRESCVKAETILPFKPTDSGFSISWHWWSRSCAPQWVNSDLKGISGERCSPEAWWWRWTCYSFRVQIGSANDAELSADDKRPLCNKMPGQTFWDFDSCTSVPPTAPAAAAVDHQQRFYHHKLRQLQWRRPCSTCHRLWTRFFSPSVRKSARYPSWKFRRGSSVATRSRRVAHGSQLLCCLTRTTLSRPKHGRLLSVQSGSVSCESRGIERRSRDWH